MKVEELYRDFWIGNELKEERISSPSWDVVARAIQEMNQEERTLIALTASDGLQMTIGGGSGEYVITLDSPDVHKTLHRRECSTREVMVTCGGQTGVFADSCVVGLETVLPVAQYFTIHGLCMPTFQWRDQSPRN